jgi:hypothetical protein
MNKFELLNSIQGGPFTSQNKMIDFDIPADMICNMAQSFIQLTVSLKPTDANAVFNYILRNTTSALNPFNVSLIRNAFISGEKVGYIEDVRRVNVLSQNMLELRQASGEKMSQIDSLYQSPDYDNGIPISPFVEIKKEGTVLSKYRDAKLNIPLSHLFSIGDLQAIDTAKTGTLRIHLELEKLEYLTVEQSKLFRSPVFTTEGQMIAKTVADNTITTVASLVYDGLEQSPYFVGQRLNLSYRSNTVATPVVVESVIVTGITFLPLTGQIQLSLSYTFPALVDPVTTYSNIFVVETTAPNIAGGFGIQTAELALCEIVGGKPPMMNALQYTTFTTEEYTVNANNLYKIFDLEPTCINAFLMFDNNTSNLLSNNFGVDSYRLRLDGVDIYDRDIRVNKVGGGALGLSGIYHDSLHYDALNRTFVNAGYTLKNLSLTAMARAKTGGGAGANDLTLQDRFYNEALQILVASTPTPITANPKKLQYTINSKTTNNVISNIILYKQIVKMIKL